MIILFRYMNKINYCLVEKNSFNSEIHDMLEEDSLSMNKYDDVFKIQYEIDKIIENAPYIKISEEYNDNKKLLEDMTESVLNFKENGENVYERHADNVMIVRDNKIKYTIFFFIKKESDDNKVLNDLCTLMNMETIPLYDSCAILKTKQDCENKELNGDIITKDDIKYLAKMLYYHKGLIIEENGDIKEVEYFGDNVIYRIGTTFNYMAKEKELYDKVVRYYEEIDCDKNGGTNAVASQLLEETIKGRIYVTLLSDNSNKFWDFTKHTVNEIFKLQRDEVTQEDKNVNKYYSEEHCDK
jgi:hypothetical protein